MSTALASKLHKMSSPNSEELVSEVQMYFQYERPKRIKAKKSYKEYISDEENTEFTESKDGGDDDVIKRRKTRGQKKILTKNILK